MGNLFGNPKGKAFILDDFDEKKMRNLKPPRAQMPKEKTRKNVKVDKVVSRGHKRDLHALIELTERSSL